MPRRATGPPPSRRSSESWGSGSRWTGNRMIVPGPGSGAPARRRSGAAGSAAAVDSRGDHRIAMAAAVAALAGAGPVEIRGAECVSKSYPAFFEDLARLGRRNCRMIFRESGPLER
ncbi:MAG: hypothetical protein M0C28_25595 [Candidatus Moduliflexus flocculans]|nr:hypothetical protein [Candidatus Moduliflexus flocculans]